MPGALSDDTDLAAKLRAISMDKARSRGGRWETIKGVSAFSASAMTAGTARAIHTYSDLQGNPIVAVASESAVNVWMEGTRYNITPTWNDVWLGVGAMVAGAISTQLIINWMVYDPATNTTGAASLHFLKVGDVVTFSNVINGAGTPEALNGSFTVVTVLPTAFTITVSNTANISVGIPFICRTQFRAGLTTGVGDANEDRPRIPSLDNFGENLVFCFSDGSPVYYWQPSTSQPEQLTNGSFTTTGFWTGGTNWAISGGVARHTGTTLSNLTQDISHLEAGKTYQLSFDLTVFESAVNEFRVQIDTVDIFTRIAGAAGNAQAIRTYTFRFVCPTNPLLLMFIADASSTSNDDVAIDNVSITLLGTAHVINEAPQKNYALFVDGNHILNLLGSVEHDGDFNPLLYRWSAQDNYREWVTSTDNIAGETTLGKGSSAVCGRAVGERNLLLTDDGAYLAQFTTNGYAVVLIAEGCGCIGPQAIAVHNNRAFWAGIKGFHIFDGAQVLPIECPIKDRYVAKLKLYQEPKTFAWINIEYGEAWFHYPHTDDGNEISRYVLYNFMEQGNPWSFGTMVRTCFVRAGVFQHPLAVDLSGNIWYHETGHVMPAGQLPFIETGYVTADAGDRWLGFRRYYPDIEAQVGDINWTITGKRAPQGDPNTQELGPYLIAPGDRKVDFRLSARQAKVKWASEETPTYWRLGIVGLEVMSERERR